MGAILGLIIFLALGLLVGKLIAGNGGDLNRWRK
jgi:hypothetical protein